MSAAAFPYDETRPRSQRADGAVRIAFRRREERSVLAELYQRGCLKARFPRPESAAWPEALLLNVSGGVAGGDHLETEIALGENTRAILASPAAERFYRALARDDPARVSTTITLAPGAHVEWLPQESILFNACALTRQTDVTLAAGAVFLGVEMLVFGRAAMGERLHAGDLRDRFRLFRNGRLQLQEMTRLNGDIVARLAGRATGAGAGATALLVYAAAAAGARREALRDALAGVEAGVSLVLPDLLIARILAPDTRGLRRAVIAGLHVLRDRRRMPRVWQG